MADENPWRSVFADPSSAFRARKRADEIKADCVVSLDANVLLAPYRIASEPFQKIVEVYNQLAVADRLIVSGQAAREFLRHRNAAIVQAIDGISNDLSKQPHSPERIALLESIPEYAQALVIRRDISQKHTEQKQLLEAVQQKLREWESTDPVMDAYRQILSSNIRDLDLEAESKAIGDFKLRRAAKIAPGWKDDGPGDYVIWRTLLQEVAVKQRHLIFVTLEKKEDWWDRDKAHEQPIFAKRELVEEYFSASSGHEFHLLDLSDFLKLMQVDPATVEAVEAVQASGLGWTSESSSPLPQRLVPNVAIYDFSMGSNFTGSNPAGPHTLRALSTRFAVGEIYEGSHTEGARRAVVVEIMDDGGRGKLRFIDNGEEFTALWADLHGSWRRIL
jgi:PIN like domain